MPKKLKFLGIFLLLNLSLGCATHKTAFHSVYKVSDCTTPVTRDQLALVLLHRGYLRSSERAGPYDVFHKPDLFKKGFLSTEPYEERAGNIGVAVCSSSPTSYVVAEELKSCDATQADRDCTRKNQMELKAVAESWGCKNIEVDSSHSRVWKLESRQDWTKESCAEISKTLPL
jgi:hypothetical protein